MSMKNEVYFYLTSICRWLDRNTQDIESQVTQVLDSLIDQPTKSPQNPRKRKVRIIYVPKTHD